MADGEVFLSTEVRLHLGGDGRYHAEHNAAELEKWSPYVAAFGRVTLVARVSREDISDLDSSTWATSENVHLAPIPDYRGLSQFILSLLKTVRSVWKIGGRDSIFIGRLPEPLSLLLYFRSRFLRARFVSLVVADPRLLALVLWNRPGRKLLAATLAAITRHCVRKSVAVVYVTQRWLQALYPAANGTPTLARSNVVLPADAFAAQARHYSPPLPLQFGLVSIGTLSARTKGMDILCRVVADLRANGCNVSLTVIGGGRVLDELKVLAENLGVSSSILFLGYVKDIREIREHLDRADVYVSASRAEGLPRATLEAMARGLPVVSTRAGGSVELVDDEYLVDIDDLPAFVRKLGSLIRDPTEMARLSQESLRIAKGSAELASEERLSDFLSIELAQPLRNS